MPFPSPPRPRLAFRVAVVGHRRDKLPVVADPDVTAAIHAVLDLVASELDRHLERNRDLYRDQRPLLTLYSGLAEGADRIGAQAALDHPAWQLHAVLPFDASAYRNDFATADLRNEFDRFCAQATEVTTLDGIAEAWDRYVPLSRVMVDAADLVVAVWDGAEPAGPGGTANVVRHARRESVPVVRIDPSVGAVAWLEDLGAEEAGRPRGLAHLDDRVRELVRVPGELAVPRRWFDERGGPRRTAATFDRVVASIAWLLRRGTPPWAARARPLALDPGATRLAEWRADWQELPPRVRDDVSRHFAAQEGWADELGRWYAARFRSSFTILLLLALFSVTAGLGLQLGVVRRDGSGWIALQLLEPVLLGCMLVTVLRTRAGSLHERWLDYRSLAEHTRHLAVLWPLGRTTPAVRLPVAPLPHDPRASWVAWLLRASAREAGLVVVHHDRAFARQARAWITRVESATQRGFHSARHERLGRLAGPLESLAQVMVVAALALALLRVAEVPELLGWLLGETVNKTTEEGAAGRALGAMFTGLPALAAGIHGFLGMADFDGTALRSAAIEGRLRELDRQLAVLEPLDVSGVGDLVHEMTRTMEGDVTAWRSATASRRIQAS